MLSIAGKSVKALELAGSLAPVPYVGAAAILLKNIVETCEKITYHKTRSQQLSNKCQRLLITLSDQSSRLEGSQLLENSDELVAVLEKIHRRVNTWAQYGRLKCFLKDKDIEDGLFLCNSEFDTAMNEFNINSHIVLHSSIQESTQVLHAHNAELRELLYQVLIDHQETRATRQSRPDEELISEQIMAAGQEQLRLIREENTQKTIPKGMVSQYTRYQSGLMEFHRSTGIPPTVKVLDGEIERVGLLAIAGGTYSDIWEGRWLGEQKVALKALRSVRAVDKRAQQRFEYEIKLWSRLKHNNILPFYGIVTDIGTQIHMVSPWQESGNVFEYVQRGPRETNRVFLLSGAADGIDYLHKSGVVHGNVKCANILVLPSGDACICDFGMSKVIEEVTEKSASATLTAAGSARWLAPELIEGIVSSPTIQSDMYSFAMTMLELLTLKKPFAHRKQEATVIQEVIIKKQRPPRPQSEWINDGIWEIMQDCWRHEPENRPVMTRTAERLQHLINFTGAHMS